MHTTAKFKTALEQPIKYTNVNLSQENENRSSNSFRDSKPGQSENSIELNKPTSDFNLKGSLGSFHHFDAISIFPISRNYPSSLALQRKCACGGKCPHCKKEKEEEEKSSLSLQKKEVPGIYSQGNGIPSIVHDVINSPGRPLDKETRAFMEPRLRFDFSNVRIHDDERASASANAVNALAYTVGRNVVFGSGKNNVSSGEGRQLMAHELTHVVQQSRGGISPGIDQSPELESDADHAAGIVSAGGTADIHASSGFGLARAPKPAEEVYYEVKFPDGVKRMTAAEFEAQKQEAIRRLRIQLKLVSSLADGGRSTQLDMLKEYHGGVESFSDIFRKPKALIGIAADMKAGVTPPFIGMWEHAKHASVQGTAALDRGDLAEGARMLRLADNQYRSSMHEWNVYREATIGGAEGVASNLETIRDVSFAIALAAGAVVAAPVIAGAVGVGGLGATGALATGLTTVGTAGATGVLGVGLGGGSSALGSYVNTGKVDKKAALRDAKKFGKQGLVTGFTAGLGTAIGAAAKGSELAKPLVQQALRRCLVEAGVNYTGEITTEALDKLMPEQTEAEAAENEKKAKVSAQARSLITGCVSGALGVPVGKIGNALVKKGADVAVGAGVSYADARLSGADNAHALVAAVQSTGTHLAISGAHQSNHPPAGGVKTNTPESHPPVKSASHEEKSPSPRLPKLETIDPEKPHQKAKPAATHKEETPLPEKLTGQKKNSPLADVAPAILKEDAIAKKALPDGHDVVVTKQGVGVCSPSPCPVIHIKYAEDLAQHPDLKKWNDKIQAMRKTEPENASIAAAALIRIIEERREAPQKGAFDIEMESHKHIKEPPEDYHDNHPTVPDERPSDIFNKTQSEIDGFVDVRERGNTFNSERSSAYKHNEVAIESPTTKSGKAFLDSYVPGKEIVSRKYPKDAHIDPQRAIDNIVELVEKYHKGAIIADTPKNREAGLAGKKLMGQPILEVPVLLNKVPLEVRNFARRAGVIIRDPEGKIYN